MQIHLFSEVGVLQSASCKKRYRLCHWGGSSCEKSSGAPSSQSQSITSDSVRAGKLRSHTWDHHGTSCLGFRAKEAALSGPPQPTLQLRSSEGWYRRVNSTANPYRKHKLSWQSLRFGNVSVLYPGARKSRKPSLQKRQERRQRTLYLCSVTARRRDTSWCCNALREQK